MDTELTGVKMTALSGCVSDLHLTAVNNVTQTINIMAVNTPTCYSTRGNDSG